MRNQFFIEKISGNFPYSYTNDQQKALEKITDFLFRESVIRSSCSRDMPERENHP